MTYGEGAEVGDGRGRDEHVPHDVVDGPLEDLHRFLPPVLLVCQPAYQLQANTPVTRGHTTNGTSGPNLQHFHWLLNADCCNSQ